MKAKLLFFFGCIAWIFTAAIATHNVLSGNIPFWFDPARDMLSAWNNFSKITLIGPPSGIPGIFYGPYWIWWLSFGELFSKDPKIVDFLTMTVPYLIGFPVLLFSFSRIFGKLSAVLLWLLFFYSYQSYMIFIWNPNLAPLLFLYVIYLLVTQNYQLYSLKNYIRILFAGILTGIALNIHISFSVGFCLGSFLFLCINLIFTYKKAATSYMLKSIGLIVSFIVGVCIVFLPSLLFEIRHGFQETHTALQAISQAGAVVKLQGLSKHEIIYSYFSPFGTLLKIPFLLSILLIATCLLIIIFLSLKKKIHVTPLQIRLSGLLLSISFTILSIYLLAKNPIWDYHFVGAEVLCLLVIGLVISKIKPLQYLLLVWVLYVTIFQVQGFVRSFQVNVLQTQSLATEEYIVTTIKKDADKNTYTVFAYSPSIYTYEYNYLFRWITGNEFSYDPGQIQRKGIVYLILPQAKDAVVEDFIHYHTPDVLYKTTKTWHIPNGTTILKRTRIISS